MVETGNFEDKSKARARFIYLLLSRYFNLMVLFMVIIVFVFVYFYVIEPQRQKILKESQDYLTEKTEIRDQLNVIYGKVKEYKANYEKIDADKKEKIEGMFVNGFDSSKLETEKLFGQIEFFIYNQGLILKSINISREEVNQTSKAKTTGNENKDQPTDIGKIYIEIEVSGVNYNSFKNLLSKIEKNMMIMDVVDLSFSQGDNSASFKIAVYYFK